MAEPRHRVTGGLHEAVGVLWIDPPAESDLDPHATVLAVELDGEPKLHPGGRPVLTPAMPAFRTTTYGTLVTSGGCGGSGAAHSPVLYPACVQWEVEEIGRAHV